jgi:hypothetical protein
LRAYGERRVAAGRAVADMIPLGQPMMPDHYSYRSDVNRRERARNNLMAGWEALGQAERIESTRASSAISSDASDAADLLRVKLAGLEAERDRYKRFNVSCRKGSPDWSILTEREQESHRGTLRVAAWQCKGGAIPGYALSNLSGRIKGIKDRIATVEREQARRVELANSDDGPVVHGDPDGVHWVEDVEANRVCVIFPGKPEREVIELVKRWGFRWNRYESRWQRQANATARCAAETLVAQLAGVS